MRSASTTEKELVWQSRMKVVGETPTLDTNLERHTEVRHASLGGLLITLNGTAVLNLQRFATYKGKG